MAGPNLARGAAERAAKGIEFQPEALFIPGIGEVMVGPEGQISTALAPGVGAFQELLRTGATPAVTGAQALVPGQEVAGMAALAQVPGLFAGLGTDPLALAEQRFEQLQAAVAPTREQERSALESRLLRQGRLDSTAGARELAEREAAITRQDVGLLNQLFQESEQALQARAGLGTQLATLGQQLGGGLFQQGFGAQQGAQQLSGPLMQLLGLSADIGGARTQADIAKAQALTNFNLAQAQTAPQGGFGGLFGSLAGGALGSFLGPVGTAAGEALGGALF